MTAFCLSRFMTTVVPRVVAFDRQYEESMRLSWRRTQIPSDQSQIQRYDDDATRIRQRRCLPNQLHIESLHFHAIDFGPGGSGHGKEEDRKQLFNGKLLSCMVLNLTCTRNLFICTTQENVQVK